jgi:hypothetical protein
VIQIGTVFVPKVHFKPGDIVYGRATTRADITGPIRVGKVVDFAEVAMCDDMNNCFIGTGADDGPDDKRTYGVFNQAIGHVAHVPKAQVFKNFLENSTYKSGKLDPRKLPGVDDQMKRITHACKGGIMMTTMNDKTIHFYIKDINMEQVAKKNIKPVGTDPFDPITSKELRFAYRHWEDPAFKVKDHMVFWNKNPAVGVVCVKPPWEEDPAMWKREYPRTGKPEYV